MEKKEIVHSTVTRAIITGFIAYGVLIGFICIFLHTFIFWLVENSSNVNLNIAYISIPILESMALYFIIHALCRLSTYDVFKKCKTNTDGLSKIYKNLSLFFIISLIVIVIVSLALLIIKIYADAQLIQFTNIGYKQVFSKDFSDMLTNELLYDFYINKTRLIISTIILNLGFIISFLTLPSFQKKVITKYNT